MGFCCLGFGWGLLILKIRVRALEVGVWMKLFFSFFDFFFFSIAGAWILMGLFSSQFVKFGIFIIYFR